jgi:tRNA pseudouridine32 synthase/23S rRNA pseudouridine746 synthase
VPFFFVPSDPAPLRVLHVDDALIAVDKPAGLLSVPGRGADRQDCAVTRVQASWPEARVVHRLDMATSGLMLLARGLEMQRRLSRAFETRQVVKHYVAVVAGRMAEAAGRIELPLAADWPRRPMQKIAASGGKPALTEWRVLDAGEGTTRLLLRPLTGRTHQLRLHLATIGNPILGDSLYAPPSVRARSARLLLHACTLSLAHPLDDKAWQLQCDTPF